MQRRILYFINPIAGPRRKTSIQKIIVKKTNEKKIPFEILTSTADGEYPFLPDKIVRENITDVVVCGGDGTINHIAAALVDVDVRLGIIPMGSGNGLAFSAKIPASSERALDVIFNNKSSYIDAFFINDRFCCMLCGVGFDAQVAHDFAAQKNRGLTTYLKQTLKNFIIAPTYPFDITVKGTTFSTDAFFVSIANSNQFGNNLTIAPGASLSDGLLDVVVVKKMGKMKLIWAVLKQIRAGQPVGHEEKNFHDSEVLYFQSDDILINNPSLAPMHIDGEPVLTDKKFKITVLPGAIKLIQP